MQPCRCRGTQGHVHQRCLLQWRRSQVVQGKSSAAGKCEVCGARYSADLRFPGRSSFSTFVEVVRIILQTFVGLGWYFCGSFSPARLVVLVLLCLRFGIVRVLLCFAATLPPFIVVLYTKGLKLSVLGAGQDLRLGLTSFGLPVDGLCSGMLLVSVNAGGPFRRTVLYVIEHSDMGSLAVILNSVTAQPNEHFELPGEGVLDTATLEVSRRSGGPVPCRGVYLVHDIEGVFGAERLLPGKSVFLNRFGSESQGINTITQSSRQALAECTSVRWSGEAPSHSAALFRGISSWGEHQLEGEVRRNAWGWIRPEHVLPDDVLESDLHRLGKLWGKLIESPHLEVFHG